MNSTKPKLKLKPRKVQVKRYVKSILEKNYYIYPYIGPMLGLKILLKPFVREIPSVKEYIKHIHQKQKNTWLSSTKGSLWDWSEMAHEYCELVNLFHSAASKGLYHIVKYILEIDDEIINAYDDCGYLVTQNAVSNLDVFKLLSYGELELEIRDDDSETTLLIYAARWGSLDVVKWIIQRAIELDSEEELENYTNELNLQQYLNNGYKSPVYLMLEKFDTQPKRPKMKKKYVLSKDIIKLLIQNGAKIPRSKLENFLYLTRHFEDMDAEHHIKINGWDRLVQSVLTISGKREYYLKNKL